MEKHGMPESRAAKVPSLESSPTSVSFETLPTELVHAVVRKLDISSFLQFRTVSRSTLSITNAMPEHRLLDPGCRSGIRRIIRWKMDITISDIHIALIQRLCCECGKPTPYVFLYNVRRICVDCSQLPQYHFVPVEAMEEAVHRMYMRPIQDEMSSLPQVRFGEVVSLIACESGVARVWQHFVLADHAADMLGGLGADAKEALQGLSKMRGYFRRHDRLLLVFPWYSVQSGRLETEFAS